MHQLGHALKIREMDVLADDCLTPEFLAINPVGKIPTLVFEDGRVLSESNAILLHFAEGTDLMPTDAFDKAKVYQWLFWEQYSHETAIAVARFSMHYMGQTEKDDPRLPQLWKKGYTALDVMENHLKEHDFFAGGRYSVADISLFAYTHVADEGGFDLSRYPKVNAWIERVKAQTGWKPMDEI
jgi:glutathione S-transferase